MRKVFCNDRSGFLEKVKIMFTKFDEFLLTCGYFEIRDWNTDSAEVVSSESGHYWIIKKFDKEGYPGLVLYHSHDGRSYHVHFCYKDHDIAPAVSEIMSHDRYQKKKMKLIKTAVSKKKKNKDYFISDTEMVCFIEALPSVKNNQSGYLSELKKYLQAEKWDIQKLSDSQYTKSAHNYIDNYRNDSAHANLMDEKKAEKCDKQTHKIIKHFIESKK